jgi:hypothetical protein
MLVCVSFVIRGISWVTKDGVQHANYFGSLTQASTCRIGSFSGEEIYVPFKSLLPMVFPTFNVLSFTYNHCGFYKDDSYCFGEGKNSEL